MSKVYCVSEPVRMEQGEPVPLFDLTPAAKYGEIEILMKHNNSVLNTTPVIESLKRKLWEFTEDDYILPVGDPVLIGIVCVICADLTGGVLRLLRWDKKERTYLPILVDMAWEEA